MRRLFRQLAAAAMTVSLIMGGIRQGAGTLRVLASDIDLTDGLTGYWTFEGEEDADRLASKSSAVNVSAVKTGDGVVLDDSGGIGGSGAISFSGNNNSYLTLNLADAAQGLTSSDAFTIGAWVKYAAFPTGTNNTSVFHQEGDGSGRAILAIGSSGRHVTYLDATNRYCSQAVQKGEWHHVMMAVDAPDASARKVYFYLDGVKTNEETFTAAFVNGSGNIRVGAHRDNANNPAVNGIMDEIRYYNKVIDADTVKAIYDLHGVIVQTQAVRESLAACIARAEDLNPAGTDTAAVNLKEAVRKAIGVRDDLLAEAAAIESMLEELQAAINAYESGTPITIAVDTSEVIREIPSAMFGINHRYHKYGYGTWDKENNKINDAFHALAKEADFGSVRYPGGTVSNLFTWKDTIGPKAERTTTIAGNNFYSNNGETPVDPAFGVDEAMTWIYDDLNAEAVFVYGLGRGTPQDAADLVEYLNAPNDGSNPGGGTDWAAVRAANGHEEPYGVTRFELGNEFSDTGQNYWMSGISENNKGVVDLYIEGDRMTISGQRSYYQTNNRVAKKGDWRASASLSGGNPDEERYVYYLPVVENTAEVFVAGEKWKIVNSLENHGAENVCTFDYETGKITFGDGTNGNIPAQGAQITCNYKTDQSGFVDYYDAMKEIDPDIELYSGIYDGHQNSFIDKMHEKGYDGKYDGVIIHPYSNGVTGYEDSLVKAKNFSNNIASYKNKMHTVTEDDSKKVAVSEFGILSVSPASNYQTSLGHAIYIANHMIDCVNSGAAYQNKHCLVDTTSGSDNLGAWQQCVIQCHEGSDGNQFVSTPSARLFSIFNQMTGNHQVRETITGNDVFTGSGNNAVNNINVYSTKDDFGNTYVMVVNNKEESAAAVDISIESRDLTDREIEIWSMTSENVADMNTLAEPDKVKIEKAKSTAEDRSFVYTLAPHSVYSFKIPAEPVTADTIVKSDNQAEGTITGIPDKVTPGDEITVTAVPAEGYEFAGWYEGDVRVSESAVYTFRIQKNMALTAKFIKKQPADNPGQKYPQSVEEPGQKYPQPVEKPAAPNGVKAKRTKKGIQISWKKSGGADGYIIYRSYQKKKGFKKIAVISKAGTKKYLDKKAKRGKTAYYKIKSFKNINGGKVLSGKYSKVVKKKR